VAGIRPEKEDETALKGSVVPRHPYLTWDFRTSGPPATLGLKSVPGLGARQASDFLGGNPSGIIRRVLYREAIDEQWGAILVIDGMFQMYSSQILSLHFLSAQIISETRSPPRLRALPFKTSMELAGVSPSIPVPTLSQAFSVTGQPQILTASSFLGNRMPVIEPARIVPRLRETP
jgi:hypothetical protein